MGGGPVALLRNVEGYMACHCSHRQAFNGSKNAMFTKLMLSPLLSLQCRTPRHATMDFLHLSYCTEEMGRSIEQFSPIILKMDNTAAQAFADDSAPTSKLRHIDLRQYWVQCLRDHSLVRAEHVDTGNNLADLWTKPLTGPAFFKLRGMFLHKFE